MSVGIAAALLVAATAHAEQRLAKGDILDGVVTHVSDVDTFEIGQNPIRLNAVNAPDRGEPLYQEASDALRDHVLGQRIQCVGTGRRSYDRKVANCSRNGHDIAAWLISQGLAVHCPRFGRPDLANLEQPPINAPAW